MPREHDPYKALRNRNYRFFLAGSALDIIGNQMQGVAVGWELYLRTHSAAVLGIVGLVQFLPVLFFSLPVGQLADRYSRKMLLVVAEILTASAAACLAFLSFTQGPVALYYACAFLLGLSQSINITSRQSLLPSLIAKDAIPNGITWTSNARQVATMIGPGLGGLLITLTGGTF